MDKETFKETLQKQYHDLVIQINNNWKNSKKDEVDYHILDKKIKELIVYSKIDKLEGAVLWELIEREIPEYIQKQKEIRNITSLFNKTPIAPNINEEAHMLTMGKPCFSKDEGYDFYIGTKKTTKDITNPKTGTTEKRQVIEPETIFDKLDDWKKHILEFCDKNDIKNNPTFYLGTIKASENVQPVSMYHAKSAAIFDSPNILITGLPGSGKTETAKSIIGTYILTTNAHFRFFDGKGTTTWKTLAEKTSKFKLGTPQYINDSESRITELTAMIQDLKKEMESRYTLFKAKNVVNFIEYNKKNSVKLKPEVLFIDDFQLISEELLNCHETFEMLKTILKMGRTVGCQIIISLNGDVRDRNMPNSIKDLMSIWLVHKSDDITLNYLRISDEFRFPKGSYVCRIGRDQTMLRSMHIGNDWQRFVELLPDINKNQDYNSIMPIDQNKKVA